MKIKALNPEHAELLLEFYSNLDSWIHDLYRPFPEINSLVIRSHLDETEAGTHISIGLFDSGHIFGHAFIMRIADPNPVFGIGLAEPYQGHRHGTRMASAVLGHYDATYQTARDRDSLTDDSHPRAVTLTVLKHNEKAIRLYTRLGFEIRGDHTYRNPNDSYFMIRETATELRHQPHTDECTP